VLDSFCESWFSFNVPQPSLATLPTFCLGLAAAAIVFRGDTTDEAERRALRNSYHESISGVSGLDGMS
jgi:hypothetical protein